MSNAKIKQIQPLRKKDQLSLSHAKQTTYTTNTNKLTSTSAAFISY